MSPERVDFKIKMPITFCYNMDFSSKSYVTESLVIDSIENQSILTTNSEYFIRKMAKLVHSTTEICNSMSQLNPTVSNCLAATESCNAQKLEQCTSCYKPHLKKK